jgi:hypothetical protein
MYKPLLQCVPDTFDVILSSGSYVTTISLAETYDAWRSVSLLCRLDPMPDAGERVFEFSFSITVDSYDGSEPSYEIQDGLASKDYIPSDVRPLVMPTVRAALPSLTYYAQPAWIYRITKVRDLPGAALLKHHILTETLLSLGYTVVDSGTDDIGRQFWLMRRN